MPINTEVDIIEDVYDALRGKFMVQVDDMSFIARLHRRLYKHEVQRVLDDAGLGDVVTLEREGNGIRVKVE